MRRLIWIPAVIIFLVAQHLLPNVWRDIVGVGALVAAFCWIKGIRSTAGEWLVTVPLMIVTGFALDYAFRHASPAVNDFSILVMAIIFGGCNAYVIARWWTRRHNRPLP